MSAVDDGDAMIANFCSLAAPAKGHLITTYTAESRQCHRVAQITDSVLLICTQSKAISEQLNTLLRQLDPGLKRQLKRAVKSVKKRCHTSPCSCPAQR